MPPSGSTTQEVLRYYDWIFAQYLHDIPKHAWDIQWSGPFFIYLWAFVFVGFFFIYALWFFSPKRGRRSRNRGELYSVVEFNGSLSERIGAIGPFSWLVWGAIVIYAGYFWIDHMLNGQVY